MHNNLRLLHVLQLSSSGLPVGGYSFSQGLESAIFDESISTPDELQGWIASSAQAVLGATDIPLLLRLRVSALAQDAGAMEQWNDLALALRESRELLDGDTAMGRALLRLLGDLQVWIPPGWQLSSARPTFVAGFALATAHFSIDHDAASTAYAWTWLENQVMAGTRLLPMGQTRAQQMLLSLSDTLASTIECGAHVADRDIGMSLPGLAMTSARHETQYSRLYRS